MEISTYLGGYREISRNIENGEHIYVDSIGISHYCVITCCLCQRKKYMIKMSKFIMQDSTTNNRANLYFLI